VTEVTLEAMLRRASRMAEAMFEKDGEVTMFWLVDTKLDGEGTVITPLSFPSDADPDAYKEMLGARLRADFKAKGVSRYACAIEAWVASAPRPSSSLPDDKGAVFIAVNSEFAVVGRRDPVTGDPCVGDVYRTNGAEKIEEKTEAFAEAHGIEVIRGAEAQDLIDRLTLPPAEQRRTRQEAVFLEASDGVRSICARRDIVRPDGRAAYLGKLAWLMHRLEGQ
jgi:hypothetical protein